MSDLYEAAVALYLTRPGDVFLSQQYINDYDSARREGGTVPDFVALDFSDPRSRELIVVEVTAAFNRHILARKIEQRHANWYRPIVRKLSGLGVVNDKWRIRFLGFVRDANKSKNDFVTESDVTFASLENVVHSWVYWKERHGCPLPGKGDGIKLDSIVDGGFG